MTDFQRVKDNETGHEVSLPAERVKALGDLVTVLEKDATDSAGEPLPPKYKTSVAKKATENNRATEQATKEGSN